MTMHRVTIYFEKGDKDAQKIVKKNLTRKHASFRNRMLVDVNGSQLKTLKKQKLHIVEHPEHTMIKLKAVHFNTAAGNPHLPDFLVLSERERPAGRSSDHWLIQFAGPIDIKWALTLRNMGVITGESIPQYAILAEMSPEVAIKVKELPFVTWVGPYEPAYKVSPMFKGMKKPAAGNEMALLKIKENSYPPAKEGNVTIVLHKVSDLVTMKAMLRKAGAEIIIAEGNLVRVSIDLSNIGEIAKLNQVKWIEPYMEPVLSNDMAQIITCSRTVNFNYGLWGIGQIISIADTGLDTGVDDSTMHKDFKGKIIAIHDKTGEGADDVVSSHGTHVAGCALGTGDNSTSTYSGAAPGAKLVFQAIQSHKKNKIGEYPLSGIPANLTDLFQEAYDDGARIHSNSWGNRMHGQYIIDSQNIDKFMWDHKDSIILFCAGNEGIDDTNPLKRDGVINEDSISSQASSKNCVSVGASENVRTTGKTWSSSSEYTINPIKDDLMTDNSDGLAAFSGRGPTDDGRPKPDIVAPGTYIISTRSSRATSTPSISGNAYYCYMTGTSMSTPHTAGIVALIREYLVRVCLHRNPSGALLKAILIHGAVPMKGQYTPKELGLVPDNHQGWGRVNAENSLFPDDHTIWRFEDNPANKIGTAEYRTFTYKVDKTVVPFKVTLAYTDCPGNPVSGGNLVNELKLDVFGPDGRKYEGGPLNNNVQQAIVYKPVKGDYKVRLFGVNVASNAAGEGKQDFSLVVSGGLSHVDLVILDAHDQGRAPTGLYSKNSFSIMPRIEISEMRYLKIRVKVHNRGTKKAFQAKVSLFWSMRSRKYHMPQTSKGITYEGKPVNYCHVDVDSHFDFRDFCMDGETITGDFWLDLSLLPIDVQGHLLTKVTLTAKVEHPEDPLKANSQKWDNNVAEKVLAHDLNDYLGLK